MPKKPIANPNVIPDRPGLEVYRNRAGTISIRQTLNPFEGEQVVVLHHTDAPHLISLIQDVLKDFEE